MITILDEKDNVLAVGILNASSEGRNLALERVVAGKGSLLGYYFGRGRRNVIVKTPAFRLPGQLKTQWTNGSRAWTVELLPAANLQRRFARPELVPSEVDALPAQRRLFLRDGQKKAG